MTESLNVASSVRYKSIIKETWKLAMPISIQALLIAGLQLVDNLFIGHLQNAKEVASGLNAFNNLNFIFFALISGFITGIGVYFAQATSVNNGDLQRDLFKAKIIWTLLLSGILLAIFLSLFKQLVDLWIPANQGRNDEYAKEYGFIVMPGMILNFIILIISNSFKETKLVKVPVIIAIIAIAINATLDYLLMYVANMGVRGSAIATIIAWVSELIIWIVYTVIKKPQFIPRMRDMFKIKISFLRKVFFKPFVWSVDGVLIAFAFTLQILFISQISTDAGASLNSAGVFPQLIAAFINGFSQAISIMIASFIAKNSNEHIKKYVKACWVISAVFGLICGAIAIALSPLMFLIYPKYGFHVNFESILMILAIGITFWAKMYISTIVAALRNSGFAKSIIMVDALVAWLIPLPLTAILVFVPNPLSYGTIYLIVTLVSMIQVPIIATFYFMNSKKLKSILI